MSVSISVMIQIRLNLRSAFYVLCLAPTIKVSVNEPIMQVREQKRRGGCPEADRNADGRQEVMMLLQSSSCSVDFAARTATEDTYAIYVPPQHQTATFHVCSCTSSLQARDSAVGSN